MHSSLSRRHAESTALVALFAALLAVMGLIPKIDLPLGVPITLQTLGVMLAGCLLGPWRALQAMLLFMLAVAVGLPLLAGGRGGLAVFVGPTAGYFVGWALAAWVIGALVRVLPTATPTKAAVSALIASLVGGIVVLHACGIAGLVLLAQLPLSTAFWGDLVFVPGDVIKCALTALVVHRIARALPDWPIGGPR